MLLEEEVEVLVVKESTKESTKMETHETSVDPAPSSTTETKISKQDAKALWMSLRLKMVSNDSEDKPSQMETNAKAKPSKKKVKKTSVPMSKLVYGGMAIVDMKKSMEKEFVMALQDRVMEETKDRKNAVEAYVTPRILGNRNVKIIFVSFFGSTPLTLVKVFYKSNFFLNI
ncbi:heat shock 70 kDa 15-like [Olea europaea subsp. europaea]|uniref:Heat shock 70 kDa 15-like n=2 Tax=Olea europaea subsp. europaea TaxID=158383 RepID=A0A8S0RNG3_OLEEU|nr:heat shock 70 kDa 15-like [Olea europaea subsp. europaea]